MKLSRQEQKRADMLNEIKSTAHHLMQTQGTAGLSIRAISREMGMTSAALYYYVDSIDALITLLIVDTFDDLNSWIHDKAGPLQSASAIEQLKAIAFAYREWALTYPVRFQLIYGNPIPGYEQPTDITYPPARQGFAFLAQTVARAIASGDLAPTHRHMNLPPALESALSELSELEGHSYPTHVLYITASLWSKFHGIVALELYHLIQPVVGNMNAFYRHEIDILLDSFSN